MLETIREYAAERLEEWGEAHELRRRHAEHFLNLAEETETHLATDAEWLDRLDAEVDNLRSALDFAAGRTTQRVLRASAALGDYWFMRGYVSEGRTRLEGALAADPEPTAARCRALVAAVHAYIAAGDEVTARARVAEALDISTALEDAHLRALAQYAETWLLTGEGEWSAALEILEDIVPVLRGLGDWDMAIRANRTRAWTYEELGDMARFWEITEENLEHARAHGHRRIEARSLGAMAELAASEGRFEDADALLTQSFRIDLEFGNLPFISIDLVRFALLSARTGRPEDAARMLARATALRDEIGFTLESWMTVETDEALAAVHAQLDDTAFAEAWEQGRALTIDEAVALALDSAE
jgi:non-specific serine/threonine protein kinase